MTEHSDFRTLNLCPGRTFGGTLVLHFNPPSLKNKASPGTVFSGQTSTTSSSLGLAVKPAYSWVVGRRVVSITLLPVDAAEFGREFFGVERRDVSGVLPRSVALRAITCICSLLRAIFVAGRRRCDAAGAALRRGGPLGVRGGLAGGRGGSKAVWGSADGRSSAVTAAALLMQRPSAIPPRMGALLCSTAMWTAGDGSTPPPTSRTRGQNGRLQAQRRLSGREGCPKTPSTRARDRRELPRALQYHSNTGQQNN